MPTNAWTQRTNCTHPCREESIFNDTSRPYQKDSVCNESQEIAMLLEKCLIEYCAPTLASLKTASLFCLSHASGMELLEQQVAIWNDQLKEKGLFLTILRKRGDKVLVYVCRASHLQADLQEPGVARFLLDYGYENTDISYALNHLIQRLEEAEDFPHEIGLFLGYPLGDVIGFIRNKGQNSKYVGCWKVYCDESEAVKKFARMKKCREIYTRLWRQGRSVWQLTVHA